MINLTEIFSNYDIDTIRAIDDYYDKKDSPFDLDAVIDGLGSNVGKLLLIYSRLTEKEYSGNRNPKVLAKKIKEEYDKASLPKKESLRHVLENDASTPYDNLENILKDLNISFKKYGVKNVDDFISPQSNNKKTLLLIDMDLDDWDEEDSNIIRNGIDILKNALEASDKFICGIFTSTVTKEQEIEKWEDLLKDKSLSSTNFLVLSKNRTSEPKQIEEGIINLVLNYSTDILKKNTKSLITQATNDALEELDSMHLNDFTDIVINASDQEGAYHYDTIFRAFSIHYSNTVRKAISRDFKVNFGNEISNINTINLNYIGLEKDKVLNSGKAKKLQLKENYLEKSILNRSYSALNSGDIFKINKNYYVVIEQQCDLQLRNPKNESDNCGRENIDYIGLLRIRKETNHKNLKQLYEIPPFELSEKLFYVDLNNIIFVKSEILDNCILNENGEFNSKLKELDFEHIGLTKGWKIRAGSVKQFFDGHNEYVSAVEDSFREVYKRLLEKQLFIIQDKSKREKENNFIKIEDNLLHCKIARVSRLNRIRTIELINMHHLYKSRIAFEPDLSKN